MNKLILVGLVGIISMGAHKIVAQDMAKSLGLYVFPANNQDQATQDDDEMACYK